MNRWLIWQLADSAFPSGGFAHSGGMEAACQHGVIHDAESLVEFIRAALQQLDRGVIGFVRESWDSPDAFAPIDARCDLFLNNHVANRASKAQGRAFLAASAGVFENPRITALARAVRENQSIGHLSPVFGLICRHIVVDQATATSLFGFIFLRSQISVAVRLGIIGPIEGQKIQTQISGARAAGTAAATAWAAEAFQISPVLDLVQGTQDRLYSRLFQS